MGLRGFRRCGSAFCVSVLVLLGAAGCGDSGGASGDVVAAAGGRTVTRATLDHWVPIEAVISRELKPQRPVPRGEVPDPPQFAACIAYTRTTAGTSQPGQSDPTDAQLKRQCRERYESVRTHMLTILISFTWLNAEAAAQGINVSDSEVRKQFAQFEREEFGSDAAFRRYEKYTGERLQDELLVTKMDLISSKLEEKIISTKGVAGARAYYHDFPHRWAAKTSCSPGYVVSDCKQYKGSEAPHVSI
jgi:hypothetical protein